MNKHVSFKHITGSAKNIPGIPDGDKSPRLKKTTIVVPEAGGEVQVFTKDPNDIIHIVLLSEDYKPLSEEEENLPSRLRDAIEQENVETYQMRKRANRSIMQVLEHYAKCSEIELIGISEMTAQEVIDTNYPIASLSEIAIADHVNRGIPIPEQFQQHLVDNEKQLAREKVAKQAHSKKVLVKTK